ncbi:MAG TPA: DUF4097 family beta strand repeat-containing protein [Leifsonia sp.]|jgi:hypothetical protein|nr:DUF4097 family beta strand repeat-containing protein [Leifsonia sp.]
MNVPNSSNAPAPSSRRPLRAALLIIGSLVLVALTVGAVITIGDAVGGTRKDSSTRLSIEQRFDAVKIDAQAADVSVRYANVSAAQLNFHQGSEIRSATLHHSVTGGVLAVTETVNGTLLFGRILADATTLELVLPTSQKATPPAIDTTVHAGNLDINGTFAAIAIHSMAGNVTLHGGALSLNVDSQSGNVEATDYILHGPLTGTTAAGDATYNFSTLPDRATLTSSAGNIRFTVPKGSYQISAQAQAGTVRQGVKSTPGASRVYILQTSAGDITVANR